MNLNTIYIECIKSNIIDLLNKTLSDITCENKQYDIIFLSDKKAQVSFHSVDTYNMILDHNRALYKLFKLDWINDKYDDEEELIIKTKILTS